MLEIRSLRKSFGALVAVDDVSFTVERGQLVGLLGPNGAGKTTTVSMIAGVGLPDRGDVLIDGRRLAGDADPAKRRLGLVPQDLALYEELTARDNLRFFGALYGLTGRALDDAMARALELVELADRARDRVKTFSGGMKRRLNLAAGLAARSRHRAARRADRGRRSAEPQRHLDESCWVAPGCRPSSSRPGSSN